MSTSEAGFAFGPSYAVGSGCCGKPVGCTATGPSCLHRHHRWKLAAVPGHAEAIEVEDAASRAARDDPATQLRGIADALGDGESARFAVVFLRALAERMTA